MAKDKAKTIRCLMDATDLPPSAFALPDDGRKSVHKQNRRKALAQVLARRADPDGSNTRQAVSTMMLKTGMSRRTVFNVLSELRQLGFLKDGELHSTGTRIRTLMLPKSEAGTKCPRCGTEFAVEYGAHAACCSHCGADFDLGLPTPVQDSGSDGEAPVQDSKLPVQDSKLPVQDSQGTRAGLNAHTTALLTAHKHDTHTGSASENLDSYKQIAKWLPEDMMAAQKKRGEREQIDALISQHGGAKFLAALSHHWELQDPESKLACKWTAFLENFDGWLDKVSAEELEEQRERRWRKEHPKEWRRFNEESIKRQTKEIVQQKFTPTEEEKKAAEVTEAGYIPQDFMDEE
jgi:Fe2+ or Zn2+ uptake regulation protein